jgi:hypothetical protein
MKVTRACGVIGLLFLLSATIYLAVADEKTDRDQMQIFMRMKLEYSRGITEGMVLERFELISQNAARMRKMSQTNFWLKTGNPMYASNLTNFQSQLDQLFLAAADRNLDGATAAYGKLLKSCIDCHHIVRKEQLGMPRWGVTDENSQ